MKIPEDCSLTSGGPEERAEREVTQWDVLHLSEM